MSRAAAVPMLMQHKAGRAGAVAAWAWGWGSLGALLITLSLVHVGEARPGDRDPTFGVRGKVTTDFGLIDEAWALVLQPDGKLVAAGLATTIHPSRFFGLARYLPDGRLDPSFGVGGQVTTAFGSEEDAALALVLQPDGKLVAAGYSFADPNVNFALARYLPDGRLDPSFGVGGQVTTDSGDIARALVLQPDGKLVAAGGILARYLPDGSLDTTFGTGGTVTTDFTAFALVLQADGKLVTAGQVCPDPLCSFSNFTLARYLPDGRLDTTFGTGGTVTTDFGGSDAPFALVLQPDGKLVAAGESAGDFALARYLPDGRLDPTFGVGGTVTADFRGADRANALVLQPDGKLVAAGFSLFPGDNFDFAVARYRPDGRLDPTFGVRGKVTTAIEGADRANALVLQPDGKLVAAGLSSPGDPGEISDFALVRYVEQQPGLEVNEFVTFEPSPATFHFTPDPTGCPEGFVGTFRFEATLTNSSDRTLSALVTEVTALTGGNLLQNADDGPGGVGALLTVPRQDGFSDGVLSPDEFVDVLFIICLQQQQSFRLMVDVLGEAE